MIKEKTERTIFDDYKWEISEIDDILKKLHRGQVMEISGNRFDGRLSTNIERLRDRVEELLNKIADGESGSEERFFQGVNSISYKK